ncbi:hypothetical protein [Nostoc sp.]|uniref:hypothetical protein n=1 Tax=Nostoc sp. TaxID=1180 RepID=UPI002FF50DAC
MLQYLELMASEDVSVAMAHGVKADIEDYFAYKLCLVVRSIFPRLISPKGYKLPRSIYLQ